MMIDPTIDFGKHLADAYDEGYEKGVADFAEKLKERCDERSHSIGYTMRGGIEVTTGYCEGKINSQDIDEIYNKIMEEVDNGK
jgi:hypothetical protein